MKMSNITQALAENVQHLLDTHTSINTQVKLAQKAGVGQATISRILKGNMQTTLKTLDAIADVFKVSPTSLISPPAKLIPASWKPTKH
jgi:transcriptional regulator with XRE-family HTH domain